MDIGSGEGSWGQLALHIFEHVTLLEPSEDALRILQRRFQGDSRVSILSGSINRLGEGPEQEPEFDAITLLDVLEHVDDASALLKSSSEYLKAGGQVVTTTPNWYDFVKIHLGRSKWHRHAHGPLGWARLVAGAGLKVDLVRTVGFPLVTSEFLSERLPALGMCVVTLSHKPA